MPPAMTSPRGGSGTVAPRSSSTSSSMSSTGSIPRREPLRRLYPLQRARTMSDSIREAPTFSDENTPMMAPAGAAIAIIDNHKDIISGQNMHGDNKRRAQRLVFVGSSTGNNSSAAGIGNLQQKNSVTHLSRQISAPGEYAAPINNRVPRRYSTSTTERSGSAERVPTYSRPSLIRRSSDVGSVSSSFSSCPVHGESSSGSSSSGSRHGSILKRPNSSRSSSMSSHSSNRMRGGEFNHSAMNHKQVQFCPNVSVVQMDEDGEHLSTHFQELNGEKRKRLGTLSRGNVARNYDNIIFITDDVLGIQDANSKLSDQRRSSTDNNQLHGSSSAHLARDGRFRDLFRRLSNSSGTMRPATSGDSTSGSDENGPLKRGQFDITFSNRPGELTKLRFVLHMGQDYNPNDLVVKANTTGSRIRVLATRTDRNSRLTEEFNEKYMLPMDIDPYEIEARLDKWGNLTVEAPLLTLDKKAEVNKNNNVLCAVYV